ncbi:FKBP-type peptidyl-prolyl cis-trans isomerase [uncultured Massilia sp.]|uniref:FKBP-type peptidyl-prolyl cis-trans isomerase n=1 Tax=uncultured Massilia sp. TaxID=169973 RepID=UPI002589C637|nr:FKBP-type peptidyl-prolyl cis-trans isomerase [uncultured Massilia sp.]
MKLKFPLIAAFVAVMSLTACGGGGDDSPGGNTSVSSPAALVKTDNTVGTGAEAVSGKTVNLNYTLWLYDAAKADHKGKQIEAGPFTFRLGANAVIPGFEQGVTGMKVGGKRTVEVPSSLGYGVAGSAPNIPGNSGLVFEIVLNTVQ